MKKNDVVRHIHKRVSEYIEGITLAFYAYGVVKEHKDTKIMYETLTDHAEVLEEFIAEYIRQCEPGSKLHKQLSQNKSTLDEEQLTFSLTEEGEQTEQSEKTNY
jgi:hypothetical protein